MANSDATLNQLSNLIAERQAKRNQIQQQFSEQLSELDKELEAIRLTMRLCGHDETQPEPDLHDMLVSKLTKAKRKKKSQMDALKIIADGYNGCFRVVHAQRLMIETGFIKTPKNAPSVIYTLLARSGKFEKVRPGEYRYIKREATWETEVK